MEHNLSSAPDLQNAVIIRSPRETSDDNAMTNNVNETASVNSANPATISVSNSTNLNIIATVPMACFSVEDIPPPEADYYAPPPYEASAKITKLPTYEEVQQEKKLEECYNIPPATNIDDQNRRIHRILTIENETAEEVDTTLLGTDFMFYIAFFVAFIFNWIGFLLLMCFCHTIASRYGALSGFGLSLAKWTFIVQHSTELASKDNSWLWWLIMTFGLIICIRAILQYLSIKRGWHMLSASHQERLLFFY